MIDIKNKKDCCGCYGCENVCPKDCIKMIDDNEGFWYPRVDTDKCIDCGLCEKVCPIIQDTKKVDNIKFIACKNRDLDTRYNSSSGGVFSLVTEEIFKQDGVVFGVEYDKDLNVIYNLATNMEEAKKFRGSKYVQSRMNDMYNEVKKQLLMGKKVMFSGTPCHVAGLKKFLIKEYDSLTLIDIACHGVPSPLVYKKYKDIITKKNNSKLKMISFRDKINGWKSYKVRFEFENNKKLVEHAGENIYMKGFLRDIYLRPSCYACKFKKPYTEADLTLADYWGVQNIHPDFDDDKGTSLVLCNTTKGKEIIEQIKSKMDIIETDGEFAVSNNPCIVRPVNHNKKREKFFENIDKVDIIENITKNTKVSFINKVKGKIKGVLVKIKKLFEL